MSRRRQRGGHSEEDGSKRMLRQTILGIVDNQLRGVENNEGADDTSLGVTEHVRAMYDRLRQKCSDKRAREMIGSAVATEIWNVLSAGEPVNNQRYCANLDALQ